MFLMRMPSKCPHCSSPMIHEYDDFSGGRSRLVTTCSSRINHGITFKSSLPDHDKVASIEVRIRPKVLAIFHMEEQQFLVYRNLDKTDILLPFFEPDVTNLHKVKEKLQTYLVFS